MLQLFEFRPARLTNMQIAPLAAHFHRGRELEGPILDRSFFYPVCIGPPCCYCVNWAQTKSAGETKWWGRELEVETHPILDRSFLLPICVVPPCYYCVNWAQTKSEGDTKWWGRGKLGTRHAYSFIFCCL